MREARQQIRDAGCRIRAARRAMPPAPSAPPATRITGRADRPSEPRSCARSPAGSATGRFVLLASVSSNVSGGLPFREFADAVGMNLGLLLPPTGAAYLWFLEVAVLAAFVVAALRALPAARAPGWERAAFATFLAATGVLSASIWAGHADLRSLGDVYLLAVLVLLGSRHRLGNLALLAATASGVAAVHQILCLS